MSEVEAAVAPEIIGEPEASEVAISKVEEPAPVDLVVDEPVKELEAVKSEPVVNGDAQPEDVNAKRKAEDEVDEKPEPKRMNPGELNGGSMDHHMEQHMDQQHMEQQHMEQQHMEQQHMGHQGMDQMGGGVPPDTTNPQGEFVGYIACPEALVSKLIGKRGSVIQHLEQESGNKIQVEHDKPGDPKQVRIIAKSAEGLEATKTLIKQTLDSEQPPGEITDVIMCPHTMVGRIIGRSGETIRSLQQASQAKIIVDQDPTRFPDGAPRELKITGRAQCVDRAKKMINELMTAEAGVSAQSVIQKYAEDPSLVQYGLGATKSIDCPKNMVGRVIGKGGETIKALQKHTGANIQIDQTVIPCKITATGSNQAVSAALREIAQIISDDMAPGAGGYGRGAMGGGYGGYGGYPAQQSFNPYAQAQAYGGYQQQQPAYAAPYGGYGGYQQQQPAYGGYGGEAQAGYGAYGGYGAQQQGAAPAAAGGGGASDWSEEYDPNTQRSYFYNRTTGATQWERPAEMG